MAIAKITLIGMYQYMNDQEDPLFKNLTVPEGMDRDKLINTILYRGAEFGVLYADPYFMQSMIGVWSDRYQHTLERWAKALAIDYDPLENYDRREDWYDSGLRSKTGTLQRTGSEVNGYSRSGSQVDTDKEENTGNSSDVRSSGMKDATSNSNQTAQMTAGTKTGDQSDETKVSAYDSSTYQPKDKTDTNNSEADATATNTNSTGSTSGENNVNSVEQHQTSGGQSSEHSSFDSSNGSDNKMKSESGSDAEAEGHSAVHTGRTHGNIGVTTSQQMLQSELDIARFNIYDEAADLFISEFCIYVY